MALTARTFVTGELVDAAKMNTIRDDLIFLEAAMGFTVQRGSAAINSATSQTDITITTVTMNRAQTQVTQPVHGDASPVTGWQLTSATNLRVFHPSGLSGKTILYEVTESNS